MILNASKFAKHFRVNLPGSWEMEFTNDGLFLNLRVRDVMSREGVARIMYDGNRDVAVTQPKLYPLPVRAPFRLQASRSYRLFFDIDITDPLPDNVYGLLLEGDNSSASGMIYTSSYRNVGSGVLWTDIVASTDLELGLGVPIAKLALFDMSVQKPPKVKAEAKGE